MATFLNLSFLLKVPKGGVPIFHCFRNLWKMLKNLEFKKQHYLESLIVIITLKGYNGRGVQQCSSSLSSFSIYTLSDLGDSSNLIGSLSRTIQQYSPPSEWIMCEFGVFPIFLENDLLKVHKILGLTSFKARKYLEGFNTVFFNLL